MVSVIYIAACALIIVRLAIHVIGLRRKHRISLGDGGNKELQKAIAAQENATEYMPITLLLLVALEINHAPWWLLHLFGITFVIARVLHAQGIINKFKWRVLGMKLTLFVMTSLVAANLVFLPYGKLV